jgi:hypothetical protein
MRFVESLCSPALLYLIYIVIQVGLDISLGLYIMAGTKVVCGAIGVYLLDAFCQVNLGIVSWIVIATPFFMTAAATTLALGLQLDKTITNYAVEHFTDKKKEDPKIKKMVGGEAPLPSNKI